MDTNELESLKEILREAREAYSAKNEDGEDISNRINEI